MMTPEERDPVFLSKTSLKQLGYGVWVNLTQMGIGLAFGFPAVTVVQMLKKDKTMSLNEESWTVTVQTLSASIGCLICGTALDWVGRKAMLVVCQMPLFIGCYYTGFATTTQQIIIGRIITGVGCGMTVLPSRIYSTEVILPNMRSVVGIFPDIAIAIGIAIQIGLGSILPWSTSCFIYGTFTVILLISNLFLPDTPYYVLMEDNALRAKEILVLFRGPNYSLNSEMAELMDFKRDNNICRLSIKETIIALFRKSAYKPFGIIIMYFIIAELSGVHVITLWTKEIFWSSKPSVDPNEGILLLACTRLIVGVFMSMLLFKVGKKGLALISALFVGIICLIFGIYLYKNEELTIVPQFFYIMYIIFATLGYYTLPYLMMTEVYPLQIRGFMAGITMAFVNLLIFSTNKLYPYLRDIIGFNNIIISFGMFSLLGTLFLYFYLPETKQLMLQEIEEYYNARRPTLISQQQIMSMQLREATSKVSSFKRGPSKSKLILRSKSSNGEGMQKTRRKRDKGLQIKSSDSKTETSTEKKNITMNTESDQEENDTDSNREKTI